MDAIVFDVGNVLWDFDILSFTRSVAEDEADRTLLCRELFRSAEWAALDRGGLAPDDALSRVQARLPERLHAPAHELLFHWYELARPFPGMEALIRLLKANGYRLYALSNIHAPCRQYTGLLPAADLFSGFFLSCEHGVVKPDPRIYQLFCEEYALSPSACLFIDDSPYNIDSAQQFGMRGLVFHMDVPDLIRRLRDRGVRVC